MKLRRKQANLLESYDSFKNPIVDKNNQAMKKNSIKVNKNRNIFHK